MIDTGSSSLAFCNKSLADEATDINKINTAYSGYVACPDSNVMTAGSYSILFWANVSR